MAKIYSQLPIFVKKFVEKVISGILQKFGDYIEGLLE